MMKTNPKFYLVLIFSFFLVACSDSDDNNPVNAYVRVLHASPDAPNVDVLVDDKAAAENVAFQQGSAYIAVVPGDRSVALRVNGTEVIALSADFTLEANEYYSVIAQNNVADLEFEVLNDTDRRNNGSTDVTVVHASPDAGNVDIYVSAAGVDLPDMATLSNVSFDQNATLDSVASADYQVRITAAMMEVEMAALAEPGVVYDSGSLAISSDLTAVAVNSTQGVSPVSLIIWTDDGASTVLDDSAEVRIVHAVDAVDVDVFAGGAELLGDFAYKDTTVGVLGASMTGYLTVDSGELEVAIAPADQGIENAVAALSGTLTLERGVSYTVIAAGSVNDLPATQLIVLVDQRKASGDTNADVRLVHAAAAPEADPVDIYVVAAGGDISAVEPNFNDVTIGLDTDYTALDGTTAYDVIIAADGTKAAAVPNTDNLTLGNASVTTAIAIGNSVANLDRIILNDKR